MARNLSLDAVPCPDPYVERLLEGVAYLAARLQKTRSARFWTLVVAAFIVATICFSRMYLGVHYPGDVVVGWLLAAVTYAAVPLAGGVVP